MSQIIEEGKMGKEILQQSGYDGWLKDAENEDKLRLIGVLKLIIDFCEELAEN